LKFFSVDAAEFLRIKRNDGTRGWDLENKQKYLILKTIHKATQPFDICLTYKTAYVDITALQCFSSKPYIINVCKYKLYNIHCTNVHIFISETSYMYGTKTDTSRPPLAGRQNMAILLLDEVRRFPRRYWFKFAELLRLVARTCGEGGRGAGS
jgi:hypothetical protein